MEPRPANVTAWMAFVLVLALAGFIAASAEYKVIIARVVDPAFAPSATAARFLMASPVDEVHLRAGVALMADVFLVLPVVLLAVIVCAAPAGARRVGWLIGLAVAVAFVAGVVTARLLLVQPLLSSGRVIDLSAYGTWGRGAECTLFFAGTLLVGGIAFVLPAVYALARMRSPAAMRTVAACGTAILAVILGAVVMPGFALSPVFGQLAILALVFATVFAVERLGRLTVSDT